jgi:hypothetical protein
MKGRLLPRLAICVVITSAITAWSSICEARRHVSDRNIHPFRHGLHLFRKGVNLPSLHSSYPCSVLGHRPCIPYGTYCSVFSHHPCLPDIDYPIGQTLQLTIVSRAEDSKSDAPAEDRSADPAPHDLNTIRDVFTTRERCRAARHSNHAASELQQSWRNHFGTKDDLRNRRYAAGRAPGLLECSNRCTQTVHTAAIHGRAWGRPGGASIRDSVR